MLGSLNNTNIKLYSMKQTISKGSSDEKTRTQVIPRHQSKIDSSNNIHEDEELRKILIGNVLDSNIDFEMV